ncbi:hypothetical protein PHYSODRAFT_487747 [Phytophthora sojae]|uniref:MULE transposase domain-containing protein n=1 Tax=Phytophthora sojae (strain P6497) TaxID=1094619 RepID=G4YVM7_PHYSP|nr:hypothetical protein PHYSODRAFT_487747 [Phytophthora sojae]EGZ26059.1 hypothetical protein PHYSODRAFT_487747 [Phytophthora sojae]|eukprot:XP_009521347.1 hypothetical protein PHYSODRAFT_487747 [Phytophthora sojae]
MGELFEVGEQDGGAEEAGSEEQETELEDEETKTEEAGRARTGPIVYNGFYYARYHDSARSTNYRCSSHKRTKGKAKVYHRADGTIIQRGEHKPGCNREIMRDIPSERPPSAPVLTADILEAIDELALEQPTLSPQEVWDHIRKEFFQSPGRITSGLTKNQVTGRFYRTKLKSFGNDVFVQIKTDPLCSVRENPSLKFFQYHGSYYEGEALHHFILWGHPALLDRLRARQTSLFVDGTFRCVPANFYQLVVVMVYDTISNLYIPSCYALATGKTTKVYDYVLYHTNACFDFAMDPAFITCDFEQALMNAVKHQFPRAKLIGCLFHFIIIIEDCLP